MLLYRVPGKNVTVNLARVAAYGLFYEGAEDILFKFELNTDECVELGMWPESQRPEAEAFYEKVDQEIGAIINHANKSN